MVIILSFVPLVLAGPPVVGIPEVSFTTFFSCDRFGIPLDYYPIETAVYFKVGVTNSESEPHDITVYISVLDVTNVTVGMDQLDSTLPPDSTDYYLMSVFLPRGARVGLATGCATVFVEGKLADGEATRFFLGPKDLTPPTVHILSPANTTYSESNSVSIVFTVNERPFWMGYDLNNQGTTTLLGNSTLTELANSSYDLTIYVNDTSGNVGSSRVCFTVLVIHDVAVIQVQCAPSHVYTEEPVNISISVWNQGTTSETFNASVYANASMIGTLSVLDLAASGSTTLPLVWDTGSTSPGTYVIMASAHAVPGETDLLDNTCLGGPVNVVSRPDISVTSVSCSKTAIGQGYSTQLVATVMNEGDRAETFNAIMCASSTPIQMMTVSLTAGETQDITFLLNTQTIPKGNYTITVTAFPVPGETEVVDNTFADGWVLVTIPGDVNADRHVNIYDLILIVNHYKTQGNPQWNPNCDVDGDGDIDICDVTLTGSHYGTQW